MVSEGVLGVRCQGETGTRRFGFEAPGRARPACSLCSIVTRSKHRLHCGMNLYIQRISSRKGVQSGMGRAKSLPSVQDRRAAIICRIWNFLGSDLSRFKKWRKWLVTSCLGPSISTRFD